MLENQTFFIAYTTFYLLGLLMSMQVPFVGFQPLRTSEHMAAAGEHVCWIRCYIRLQEITNFCMECP